MSQISIGVPLDMAAALEKCQCVVTMTPLSGGRTSYHWFTTGPGEPLTNQQVAAHLREAADLIGRTPNPSPDADQGMPTPGAGVHVHAPGVRPN